MIRKLSDENIEGMKKIINEAISTGKNRFEIVFTGGKSELIENIEGLIITEKAIVFGEGRNIDIKNISKILADGEAIVIIQ